MKKSYLTLGALAMIMASCSNEVLVDNESGQTDVAIGFSTFSDLTTKADPTKENLEKYHGSFTVYGTKKNGNEVQKVFDAVKTNYVADADDQDATGEWHYSPARYWDKQATYNFIAVAPSNAIVKYSYTSEVGESGADFVTVDAAGYTLKGQNLQSVATSTEKKVGFYGPSAVGNSSSDDTDILTSAVNPQTGSNHDAKVELIFKHILAKLNVTVAKSKVLNGAVVKVDSIVISGLDNNGKYVESNYDAAVSPKVSGWNSTSAVQVNSADYVLKYKVASATATDNILAEAVKQADNSYKVVPTYFIESLVMPQAIAAEKLVMKYSITTTDENNVPYTENFTYSFDMKDAFSSFYDRCNYNLKFTIAPDVIVFDATSYEWTNVDKEIIIE